MEIITGVERRRRWRPEDKLRIRAELDEPGAKFAEVARRHEVSRGLLWQWRDAQRRGRLVAETPGFLPLQVMPDLATSVLSALAPSMTAMRWTTRRAYTAPRIASAVVARRRWSRRRRRVETCWLWRVRERRKWRSSS